MKQLTVLVLSMILFAAAQDANQAQADQAQGAEGQKQTLKSGLIDAKEARNQVQRCRNIIGFYITQKYEGTELTEEDQKMTINYRGLKIIFIIRQGRRFIVQVEDPTNPEAFNLTIYDNNADGRIDYFVAVKDGKNKNTSSLVMIRELSPTFYEYMQNLIDWDEEETQKRIKAERDFFRSVLTRLKGGA